MANKKFITYLFLAIVIISSILAFFNGYWLTGFINSMFIIGLILLIIGGFSYLRDKKAFIVTGYTMKKFKMLFSPDKKKNKNAKKLKLDDYIYKEREAWQYTIPLLITAGLICIFTFILSIVLY